MELRGKHWKWEDYTETGVSVSTGRGGKLLESRADPRKGRAAVSAMLEPGLAGGALRGVVLLRGLLLALLRGGGLRILGKGYGHGGGKKCEAEHQRKQFLHCGC